MKKAMMMIAMLMATVAMQAQTKFHDVEANDAQGPVKSLEISVMGQTQKFNFTKEGKMDEGSSLVPLKENFSNKLHSIFSPITCSTMKFSLLTLKHQ